MGNQTQQNRALQVASKYFHESKMQLLVNVQADKKVSDDPEAMFDELPEVSSSERLLASDDGRS